MTPADLSAALLDIVTSIVDRRRAAGADLGEVTVSIDDVPLERPKNREHGDWASNAAMRLAKKIGT
ncbi:MAG: arginine--tRNA ligase, partial [Leifsonia sp.]